MSVILPGETLTITFDEGVVEVQLARDPCNEIGTTTLSELERLVAFTADHAHDIRGLVMHSAQAGFCAGADLRELHATLEGGSHPLRRAAQSLEQLPQVSWVPHRARGWVRRGVRRAISPLLMRQLRSFLLRIHAVFDALDQAPFTTVAAVHGVCFGGGLELALTADMIVADRTARFAFPELRLGLVPGFGGVPRLEREVGNATVRDLLLTGRSLRAKRAHEVGLVSQLVAKGEALNTARAMARQAARFHPATVARAKRFIKPLPRRRLNEEIDTFCEMFSSGEIRQALDRFVSSSDVRPYLP